MFTQSDIAQLNKLGIDAQKAAQQIENFKKGFPFAQLKRAATGTDGILQLTEQEIEKLNTDYAVKTANLKVLKFVPASGAASRMFKELFSYAEKPVTDGKIAEQIKNYHQFAFSDALTTLLKKDSVDIDSNSAESLGKTAEYILGSKGLNYGYLPKGLIIFHKYTDGNRTAFEEHLVEAAEYACGSNKVANIHFTVSPEHQEAIDQHIKAVIGKYEKQFGITYDISFSVQHPSTDTIAVNMDNTPFREKDGSLLFRPGGHGALIENLNEIKSDIIFIKNIDNVVPDRLKKTTYDYKKALGSKLIEIREMTFEVLRDLEKGTNFAKAIAVATAIGVEISENENSKTLFDKLNRPIRICGMVKNEGEPGGGPFWVKSAQGVVSLQIIESSQIDEKNPEQKSILDNATHFNPVDLVCSVSDYKGNQFDLHKFIDPETGFISYKSKDGKELKAQELPGLWNGAMANWITLFVEVPMITFNPVKTLSDLLRKEHQS